MSVPEEALQYLDHGVAISRLDAKLAELEGKIAYLNGRISRLSQAMERQGFQI